MKRQIITNIDVVVYALGKIGGAKRMVLTENIAYESFKLSPDRFSWVKEEYHKLPDKYVVKTTLEDAAKEKNGGLVTGGYARDISRDGWILTPSGVRWLEKNGERIANALDQQSAQIPKLSPKEVNRFRSRFEKDSAFKSFKDVGSLDNVTHYMFVDLLEASPDAPPDLLRYKFQLLISLAQLAKEDEIEKFLYLCEEKFSFLFKLYKEE